MMVALLLYAYAIGERSSRRIERRCHDDVAVRVITANQAPDHTTIARFRQRHETAPGELFGEVLALCAEAGLIKVGVIAIDGTKVHANAFQHATATTSSSRARSSKKRPRPTGSKTSTSARRAATSWGRSFRRRRADAAGCAKPGAASTSGGRRRRGRSRRHARPG